MSVAEQLEHVRGEIRLACGRSGRNPEEVTLIAVSKTKPEMKSKGHTESLRKSIIRIPTPEMKRRQQSLPRFRKLTVS